MALESVGFGSGRFVANSTGNLTAQYQITDHLGSVRVVFTSPTNIVAQNDYYAFGLRHSNPSLAQNSANRHLFNGKEWQSTGSVGLLDYGARPYDPNTGRWINLDPLAEKRMWLSPYNFVQNNPINRIDLDGTIDWKAVFNGTLQTILGAGMVVGGAAWSTGTVGIGAALGGGALIMGGMSQVSFGVTKLVGGFASDGSEAATNRLESLPASLPDLAGIVVDVAMGNENHEARNVANVVEGLASFAYPNTGKPIIDAISTLSSAGQVAEGATNLIKSSNSTINIERDINNDAIKYKDKQNENKKYGFERQWVLF